MLIDIGLTDTDIYILLTDTDIGETEDNNMITKISLDGNEISSDTLKELYDRNGDVKINKENKISF